MPIKNSRTERQNLNRLKIWACGENKVECGEARQHENTFWLWKSEADTHIFIERITFRTLMLEVLIINGHHHSMAHGIESSVLEGKNEMNPHWACGEGREHENKI